MELRLQRPQPRIDQLRLELRRLDRALLRLAVVASAWLRPTMAAYVISVQSILRRNSPCAD